MHWFFKIISRLPLSILYVFSYFLYLIIYKLVRYRVKVVEENLRNSFPAYSAEERKKIKQLFYRNLADVVVEILKVPTIRKDELIERVKIKNINEPLSYYYNGQSIICLTGHLCNWEWLLLACSMYTPCPIDAVYKPMHIAWMEQLFKNMRSRFGARPVPMKDVLKSIIRQKEKVRIIAMVADQTPPEAEIQYFTIFFNQNTPFFVGGDKLSKYMNAPVFFVDMRRVKRGYYEIEFISLGTSTYNEQGAYAITERYARKLEERIKSAPQDWLWSHKRWKHKTWKWENQK